MNKTVKYKFIVLVLLAVFLMPFNVKALLGDDYGYDIEDYFVNIKVNENNTYDITEEISVNFNVAKHGIIRHIPIINDVIAIDGTKTKNVVRITNLKVNNKYTKSRSEGNLVLKIGDARNTVMGKVKYVISYNYNIGKDPHKDIDEFYLNIIGTEWDTKIANVRFVITMPKEFDKTKLGFSVGRYGIASNEVESLVEGNEIRGKVTRSLGAYEGVTVRLELEDGYYVGAGTPLDMIQWIIIAVSSITLVMALMMWGLFGRDKPVVETVEFYPPEGKNSLEVAFLYKGKAKLNDVLSLLVYLAQKGYLKITEEKKDFIISKVKDYDGTDELEKMFYDGVFSYRGKDDIQPHANVRISSLKTIFYKTSTKILAKMNSSKNKKLIDDTNKKAYVFVIFLLIVSLSCILITLIAYDSGYSIFPLMMFAIIFIPPIVSSLSVEGGSKAGAIVGIVMTSIFFIPFIFSGIFNYSMYDPNLIIVIAVNIVSIIGISVSLAMIPKRNEYGTQILGKLKGFRNFLKTAEKEKLEMLVSENPSYFYDILPYTYVLGVSRTWIKKFEDLNMPPAQWADVSSPSSYNRLMNKAVNTANAGAPVSSSSGGSSGGGFSGGGFSGGGSGGGGGSSW